MPPPEGEDPPPNSGLPEFGTIDAQVGQAQLAEGGPLLHDVECVRSRNAAQAKVEPVPPEEFGISRNARSLRDCDYCFHKVLISEARLIAQGFDKTQVRALPTYTSITNAEELDRNTVDESQYTGDQMNQAARRIEVTEHYIRMDYAGDGKAGLYKVTTGGSQGDVLKKDGKLDIEPFDLMPFAAMTPVIVTHRFFGRSIADLVMDIQRIKTALRAMLDNAYLANNPRVEVAEQFAGPDTLDDLLVSRPGGIVRTKQPGGLTWQVVPSIAAQAFPVLEYMDAAREFRTGVTRQGQGIDADALQNQSATAVNQVFTAAGAHQADRPHLCRDRHPRAFSAPASDHQEARRERADRAATQAVGHGQSARVEDAQRIDRPRRARHRHETAAARHDQHDRCRAGEGHRRRPGVAPQPAQFGDPSGAACRLQERG
jgi:hypothetical protein